MTGKRIDLLVIDDQVDMLESLYDILQEYGYNVTMVDSGEKGIELIKNRFFDLALVDMQMPGIDGLGTFREIHKFSPATKVLMMTAASIEDMVNEALKDGAFAVVYKPFQVEKLIDMLEQARTRPVILVADDRWEDREVMKDILEEKYTVVTAKDGAEAVQLIDRGGVNIVFLDVRMPVMDGFAALDVIKKSHPNVGVIMMTGYNMDEGVVENIKKDAFALMYKPFHMENVLSLIESLHEKKQQVKSSVAEVLLIDDEENVRETLGDILTDEGYKVTTVSTGKGAFEEINKKFFNLVITDFHLPDSTGLDIAKKIKDDHEDIYIILMTGQASLDMAQKAIQQDIFDYLIKPVKPEVLIKTMNKALDQQRLRLENKKMMEELKRMNDELKKLDELKSKFLSMVTHDLRTPLTSIKGYNSLLRMGRRGPVTPEQIKILEIIDREADHLNGLIGDLLDLSRIEAGKLKVEKQWDSIASVIEAVFNRVKTIADGKGVIIEKDVQQDIPAIFIDPARIEQVLTNFVTNATKHTKSGDKIIIIGKYDEKGKNVVVEVVDTGEGIPPQELTKLFNKFYQIEGAMGERAGLGLGLAICKEIISLHRGQVYVHSDGIGRGSKFWFVIPVQKKEDDAVSTAN